MSDLAAEPDLAVTLVAAAAGRLLRVLEDLDDSGPRRPSLLPDWTVGHVLTHLARNADGHRRRVLGALEGLDVPKYSGGAAQRETEIAAGASRPATTLISDLRESERRLAEAFARAADAGWPTVDGGAESYPASASPAHRLRELEMHHVDLGLGYSPTDWSPDYTAWELENLLTSVPGRLDTDADRAAWVAWLAGRGPRPEASLSPWG